MQEYTRANFLGEFLRERFFNQSTGLRGCYSTFELNDGVEFVGEEKVNDDLEDESFWNIYRKTIYGETVIMKYYWDGDGVLRFELSNGMVLENGDCKKDYTWRCVE